MNVTHYTGKCDGDIKQYINESKLSGVVCPAFKGYEPFEQLWDLGAITPEISSVRLMFNFGRGDEHYLVVSKDSLEGVELRRHSGKKGVHDTRKILEGSEAEYWEISGLNPMVLR